MIGGCGGGMLHQLNGCFTADAQRLRKHRNMPSTQPSFMDEPIPRRKKRMKPELAMPKPTAAAAETAAAVDNVKNIACSAIAQISKLVEKHESSKEKKYGEANLFFEIVGKKQLRHFLLQKRCISANDCIVGQTYMDTTSFSNMLKNDECPMIAFSRNGKRWQRGYLITLGVRKTVILGVKGSDEFAREFARNVTIFSPMGDDKDVSIKYINLVDVSMDSALDGALVSKTEGPDMIHVCKLPDFAMNYKRKPLERIIQIPKQKNLQKKPVPTPFHQPKEGIQTKREAHLIKNICSVPSTSDYLLTKEKWKNHIAFMSPDEKEKLKMVPIELAREIINCGSLSRQEFLRELDDKSSYTIDCTLLDVPLGGLALAQGGDSSEMKKQRGKELFQCPEDIFALYSLQDELEVDKEALSYLVYHVTNGHSRKRASTNCTGINFNRRKNISDKEGQSGFETIRSWVSSVMNPTFAPLFYHNIDMLARFSTSLSAAFDPVANLCYSEVYQEIMSSEDERDTMKFNKDSAMGNSSLQILTFPDQNGINFANGGHIDVNDANDKVFNQAMEGKLEKHLIIWLKEYSTTNKQHVRDRCLKNIDAIFHLMKRGKKNTPSNPSGEGKAEYTTNTTCAYQIIYNGESDRTVLASFAFPQNKSAIRISCGELLVQHWDSCRIFHQTTYAITYDNENVYLKDKDLVILAWGAGTSKRADFLDENNIPHHGNIHSTRRLCELLRDNNASEDVINLARTRFSCHQSFITAQPYVIRSSPPI